MKKIIITLVALIAFGGSAMAQMNLGARIHNSDILGAEISFQFPMGDANRIELDLGAAWGVGPEYQTFYTTATGAYHWTFPIVKGLQWFIGPGAQVGLHTFTYEHHEDLNRTHLRLAAVAQGGIEYNFDFPLQLALDVRPGIDLLGLAHADDVVHPWVYSYAFSVRYRF